MTASPAKPSFHSLNSGGRLDDKPVKRGNVPQPHAGTLITCFGLGVRKGQQRVYPAGEYDSGSIGQGPYCRFVAGGEADGHVKQAGYYSGCSSLERILSRPCLSEA